MSDGALWHRHFVVFLHVGPAATRSNKIYAAENQAYRYQLGHIECVEPYAHRNHTSHYGLHIVVHAGHCRPQALLPGHHEYIAQESGTYHDICQGTDLRSRKAAPPWAVKGKMQINENVNIHFMIVTSEYLLTKFLYSTR